MNHKPHNPADVAPPEGGYSLGVEVAPNSRYLFISGQIPTLPNGDVPATFDAQCHAVWNNITAVLASAGLELRHLVKVTTFLASPALAAENGRIRREHLGALRPALTVVGAALLDSEWLLEIEAVAASSIRSGADT